MRIVTYIRHYAIYILHNNQIDYVKIKETLPFGGEIVAVQPDQTIELLTQNMKAVSKVLRMISVSTRLLVASQFTAAGKYFSAEEFDHLDRRMKKGAGWFSALTRDIRYCLDAMLLAEQKGRPDVDLLLQMNRRLIEHGFSRSQQTYLAAAILTFSGEDRPDAVLEKGETIYGLLKKRHFFLTQKGDVTLVVLLARLDERAEALVDREEHYFSALQQCGFRKNDPLQSLACLLAFLTDRYRPAMAEKCAAVKKTIKDRRVRLQSACYPVYGTLALLDDVDRTVTEVLSIQERIKKEKFGLFIDNNLYFQIAAYFYVRSRLNDADDSQLDPNLVVMADALIRAQEAMTAAAAASGAAAAVAAASSSGSN
jgi:hypothetical protein